MARLPHGPVNALGDTVAGSHRDLRWGGARLAAVVTFVVLAVIAIPGLGNARARLAGADPAWVGLACALELGSVIAFAGALHGAFARRLRARLSWGPGMTDQGVNALAPAGGSTGVAAAGAIASRAGLDGAFIAERSVGLFLLTSVAPNVLLILVGGFGVASGALPGRVPMLGSLAPAFAALVLLAAIAALGRILPADSTARESRWRMALGWGAVRLREGIFWSTRAARLGDPLLAAGSLGYVLLDLAALVASFRAVGSAAPPVGTLLLAYALGQAGSIVSLPGAAAGGMVGTFALYHVPLPLSFAAVLLYQLISTLLPLALGATGAAGIARWASPISLVGCRTGAIARASGRAPSRDSRTGAVPTDSRTGATGPALANRLKTQR